MTVTEQQFPVNVTDIVTSSVSDHTGSVIKNETLISPGDLYKNVTEDFWSIFNLNSSSSTWRGNMSLNLNATSELDLPDNISQLSCDFLKEYGSWNLPYKYSREDLKAWMCVCTGMCKEITLAPDVKQKVHEEIYGALSDRNRPVFIAVVTVYSLLLLIGITGKANKTNEPRHEKTCLWGLRPDKTQTGLRSHRT